MTKSVIITGVNGGIGKALSVAFSNNGYTTIGLDIVHDDSNCDYFIPIDLNRFASETEYRIEKSQKLLELSSDLEVLINNAAIQLLDDTSNIKEVDWFKTLNINLSSPFFLSQLCLDSLKKNKGSIINITSIHAKQTKKEDVNTGFIYNPLHQFCVSLLVIENEDVKNNLLQTHPNLRFHCDTTERDRMDLLTPDVLRSLTAPIAYVYKKNIIHHFAYIYVVISRTSFNVTCKHFNVHKAT